MITDDRYQQAKERVTQLNQRLAVLHAREQERLVERELLEVELKAEGIDVMNIDSEIERLRVEVTQEQVAIDNELNALETVVKELEGTITHQPTG